MERSSVISVSAGQGGSENPEFAKHLNRYDIIKLDITAFRRNGENASELLKRLNREVIAELRESYGDALKQEEDYLPSALADIHNKTGTAFIFIIDEWDERFRESKFDTKTQKAYLELLRGLFKGGPSKKFVPLAYLTGILPIKKYNGESALNNFREFTTVNPRRLAGYVGFTEPEVRGLCGKYGMDFSEAQRWYDGYSFRNMQHIYSPNSIVNAMLDGEFGNYWTSTVAYESLRNYISMNFDGLKDAVMQMPAGKGYADIVFLPKKYSDKPAMVVELKYNQTAEGAIAQIKNKQYMSVLEEYRGDILLVGINYN